MSINDMIVAMQHYRDGGEVECENIDGSWFLTIEPCWNFEKHHYRIKEKPKTKTVYEWIVFDDCPKEWTIDSVLLTEDDAESFYEGVRYQKTGRQWEVPND